MRAVIFVGPSLAKPDQSNAQISVAPPAGAGDVYVAVEQGAQIIGLIDARFENEQTVRHDELLYALDRGVHVLGSASMGALRAVECAPFGMRGHGRIFEMYRDKLIDGDHEVALQYGPAELGWPVLSVPLVNVRATLDQAVETGTLTEPETAAILKAASTIYYKGLTWEAVQANLGDAELRRKLAAVLAEGYVDLKAQDAQGLVSLIAGMLEQEHAPFTPEFAFNPTLFWQEFVADQRYRVGASQGADRGVLDELRLDPVRYSDVLLRAFARRAAAVDGAGSSAPGQVDAFRAALGLMTGQTYREWLVGNRTDEADLLRFLERDAELEWVLEQAAPELERDMLDELRAEDQFATMDTRAAEKRKLLEGRSAEKVPAAFAEFDLKDLLDWFCRSRRISGDFSDPDEAARSLGLADRQALHILLRREFEYVQESSKGGGATDAAPV